MVVDINVLPCNEFIAKGGTEYEFLHSCSWQAHFPYAIKKSALSVLVGLVKSGEQCEASAL
jgi:hypothetical protein